ncbi:phosphate/phosphite/phosphonate ABC transporter substrate-binding protein [Methylococcus sp. EFPC2]|uniref:phosphate/phosphite/phosphonate ABC transporter substrate-binding protein n=1 Tax=Methylococcus sp. EFPC2 TaxID=2812648 RepID=UPI001966F9D7|nr:PhnD/SsuA/transferrin family substrate-binding protein [Methylococcus sp. EFPC2]QSA96160.1 PhnD/SsuA/transferrin family substrate-binding protein [Methylococcus sp. EFPC2]
MAEKLIVGAVAHTPEVVTIWEGYRAYFVDHGLPFDYVLFSNYEHQVEAQFDGTLHLAWNSPLAWLRADRIAKARGLAVSVVAMRDCDRDLRSVIVVRADDEVDSPADLRGKTIGFGAVDSPQASLIPLAHLRLLGLRAGRDFNVRRFDVNSGKHGNHVDGEREAAAALMAGEIDAACMIEGNHSSFANDAVLTPGSTRVLARTDPYDHCNFTASPGAPVFQIMRFVDLLLALPGEKPAAHPRLKQEGLGHWVPGRTTGYSLLQRAVDEHGFYGRDGSILASDYRY